MLQCFMNQADIDIGHRVFLTALTFAFNNVTNSSQFLILANTKRQYNLPFAWILCTSKTIV